MFFPGETIAHTFVIPFVPAEIDHVIISYKQNGGIVLEKIIDSGFTPERGQTKITLVLTQAEGLMFEDDMAFTIQLNVFMTENNCRMTSRELNGESGVQYYREIMKPRGA